MPFGNILDYPFMIKMGLADMLDFGIGKIIYIAIVLTFLAFVVFSVASSIGGVP